MDWQLGIFWTYQNLPFARFSCTKLLKKMTFFAAQGTSCSQRLGSAFCSTSMIELIQVININCIVVLRQTIIRNFVPTFKIWRKKIHCPKCSATGMGQFPICKLKWDLLRTSVTACTIDENIFSAPFGMFYVRTEI